MGDTWLEAIATAVADELERRAALRRDAGHRAHCPHWPDGGRCCCCGDPALPAPEPGADHG